MSLVDVKLVHEGKNEMWPTNSRCVKIFTGSAKKAD